MRIQFLIAAHKDPELLARLAERLLTAPDASVTVQWDRASPPLELPPGLDVARRITATPCEWGSGAQLRALLDSMRGLSDARFDWLVVLSGQDYPVQPLGKLHDFLAGTPHGLFLETHGPPVRVPEPGTAWSYPQDRYFYQYHWVAQRWWAKLPDQGQRLVSGAMKATIGSTSRGRAIRVQRRPRGFSPAVGFRAAHHPFSEDRPCRKGSDWFALSRPVFDDLLARGVEEPELVDYYLRTYLPSESFFHTVLLPKWESHDAGHNLHYSRFQPGRAHPDTLHEADWEALGASRAFFARKVDAGSAPLLDRIDRDLLHFS